MTTKADDIDKERQKLFLPVSEFRPLKGEGGHAKPLTDH